MDRFICGFVAEADGDLMLCRDDGVAYQADMSASVPYDAAYFAKYVGYEGQEIARRINAGRVALVNEYVGERAVVLDVGIGSGEFIKSRPETFGHDVNPVAVEWLKERKLYSWGMLHAYNAYTFWDVLEHVPEPETYFNKMAGGSYLFICLPIFDDLSRIRESKHYRPNEHYYYWTKRGFVQWMALYGFELLTIRDFETMAGRENILSFAFRRISPPFRRQ